MRITLLVVMNNRIAIFSDLHLGVHQNSNFWIDTSAKWAEWFKNDLESKDIDTLVFCGDLFHYRDEVSLVTLDAAQRVLEILKDFKIYMITGNHDCYYKETSEVNSLSLLKGWSNITVFDKLTSNINIKSGTGYTFCPWGTKLTDIPKSNIVFGHFELKDFKMNMHKICDDGDDPAILSEKTPLVFSGHFHLRDEKTIDGCNIVYIGNPFEMDFGDSLQKKGYYILDTQRTEYTFIEYKDTPKHINVHLSRLVQLKEVEDHFNSFIPNNIIKLTIDKNISTDHLDSLVAKLQTYKPNDLIVDHDVNYNKIKLKEEDQVDLSGVDIVQAIEEFVNLMDINNKKEVVDYTVNLYNRSKL